MAKYYEEGFNPKDLSITVSELLVATADASDELLDSAVSEVLALLKDRLKMDVVFVSEFVDGKRVFRYVDANRDAPMMSPGDSNPLEETWCQRVVDGRIPELIPNVQDFPGKAQLPPAPFDIGTHISTPVLLGDGHVYGTLCCLSFSPHESVQERDLKNLKSVAMLVATKIDKAHARAEADKKKKAEPLTFTLMPKQSPSW
jgi:GAF domain-containing protein